MGLPEIIVILVVALLVVGPSKLPELARSLGKAFNDFRKMADEVKETIEEAVTKEETPKEGAAKEGDPKEEEPAKTETVNEETTKEEPSDVATEHAEGFWEHDVYGEHAEIAESTQTADAGEVTQEKIPGGDKKQTETKT